MKKDLKMKEVDLKKLRASVMEPVFQTSKGTVLYLQECEYGGAFWSTDPDAIVAAVKEDMLDPDPRVRVMANALLAAIDAMGIRRLQVN